MTWMIRSFFILALLATSISGATRRALIVGINQYQPKAQQKPAQTEVVLADKPVVKRGPVFGRGGNRVWSDLDGSFNDASLMRQYLIDRLGFRAQDIIFLTDEEHAGGDPKRIATAQNILDSFQNHLIDAAQPGDTSFFFYAGHGSQIENRKTEESDGKDETLVPADTSAGTPDIRDKELARLYRAAVRKGIALTVVLDSCHSGGVARGSSPGSKTRTMPPDTRYVEDPPDLDPGTGKPLPDPTAEGVLVIGAAQDNEAARELDADGQPHGAFTYYFVRALQSSSPKESVERLFAKTQALMLSGTQMQLPSLNTSKERMSRDLLNEPADSIRGLVVPIAEVRSNGSVLLRGGRAVGLEPGCELVFLKSPGNVRLQVTSSNLTLAQAEAKIIAKPDSVTLRPGDEFLLDKWVLPATAATTFYLPSVNVPAAAALQTWASAVIGELQKRNITLVDDPTAETPDQVLRWSEGKWQLEIRSKTGARVVNLGASPMPAAVVQALGAGQPKLFIDLPPSAELVAGIRKAVGQQSAMRLRDQRPASLYQLAGRWRNGSIEYAWVLAGVTQSDMKNSPLPVRTHWVDGDRSNAGSTLQDLGFRIARIRLWLQMDSPGGDEFPYEMVLRETTTNAEKTGGVTVEGEEYHLWFRLRSGATGKDVAPKWIYVASIDSAGTMRCLFPRDGSGNTSESKLPKGDKSPREFRIPGPSIRIIPEFGVDTLIAIVADEPIDTGVLNSEGVRSARGGTREGALEKFLMSVQSARGYDAAAGGFTVQRLTTRSVSKAEAGKK